MPADQLNQQQRTAASAGDGAHLVVAGAGTGKTRTLTERVAHLVRQGVPADAILLVTFTRRAAQEMLRRVAAEIGSEGSRVHGGTFHALAVALLRRHAKVLGFSNHFTVLDRGDSEDLVGMARTAVADAHKGTRFPKKSTLLNLFSKAVNTGADLSAVIEEDAPQYVDLAEPIAEVGQRYAAAKRAQQVMDYDDLLVFLRQLLREHPAIRKRIAQRYCHVLIDEYQDTNRLQAEIGCLLASGHRNITVVGDEAQSIYRFRGADFRNIMDFPRLFPDGGVHKLETNYRSVQPVLDLANAVLAGAHEGYRKVLRSARDGGDKPILLRTDDEDAQAAWIVGEILRLREEGVELAEMAILARSSWHTNLVEVALEGANLPFRKYGGMKFIEATHIKDVACLLRLSENARDVGAWYRVLQWFPGLGAKTATTLGEAIAAGDGSLALFDDDARLGRARNARDDLLVMRAALEGARARPQLAGRLTTVLDYYRSVLPRLHDDAHWRERDLDTLLTLAGRYQNTADFLADIAIDPPELKQPTRDDKDDECLTVSTIHSAKGLEWRVVFVLNVVEGAIPNHRALFEDEGREEERRLFYVAITRAKDRLVLGKPEYISQGGGTGLGKLSSFLTELACLDDLVERVVASRHYDDYEEGMCADEDEDEDLDRILDYFA